MSLLRHGLTSLRRAPLLALTIFATLGLAPAATVVAFTFLNSCLLRPLPSPQLDLTVIAAVSLAALAIAAATFSAVPRLQTRRLNLETTLREGGRSAASPGAARTDPLPALRSE